MKKFYILMLGIMVCFPANSQLMKNLDHVGNFNEGLAAIKKGDQWAFMDEEGKIVIDFRNDLVASTDNNGKMIAPVFSNGLTLVSHTEDGITYYGYIDTNGKEVIPAKYVNATPFKNGYAIVMQYTKEVVGQNKILGKDVVSYKVEEFVINVDNKAMTPMLHIRNCVPEKMKAGTIPQITTKFLNERMVAVETTEGRWEVYTF